jgi:hippurate hydrolase
VKLRRSQVLGLPLVALALATAGPAAAVQAADTARIKAVLAEAYPHIDSVYKDIHSHPELGFYEVRTAALLAKEMRGIGFEVAEKVGGGTGIVAVYRNGPGPTVLVRTELDALPMEEKTGLPYASKVQTTLPDGATTFVDHSCGHDIHMAWWLATAKTLVALKDRWSGTVIFVGQPAEEIGGAVPKMLASGMFAKFGKPDYAFAAHIGPGPVGEIRVKEGVVSANSDTFKITFKGRGGHGSSPNVAIDPIVIAARFVTDVQMIVAREKPPAEPGVISVGSFHAGTVGNIIPDQAEVQLTMRSLSPEVRALFMGGMQRTARTAAAMANAPEPTFERIGGGAVSVVNNVELAERLKPTLTAAFGDQVGFVPKEVAGQTGTEDYSEWVNAGIPNSIFFWVGGSDPKTLAEFKARGEPPPANHSPFFAPVPEPSIKTGATLLTLAVMSVAPPKGP